MLFSPQPKSSISSQVRGRPTCICWCVVPFGPGCIQGWLCQSPVVWPSRNTLHCPLFLVAEFPGAAITKRWIPGCVAVFSHCAITWMSTGASPGSSSGCKRGEGGGQHSIPLTQDEYRCRKAVLGMESNNMCSVTGMRGAGEEMEPSWDCGGIREGEGSCPREPILPSLACRDGGLPVEQRVQQRRDLPPEVPLRIWCGRVLQPEAHQDPGAHPAVHS